MEHDLQATLVPVPPQLRRSFLPILRYPLRTFPGAEAAPADLGRWAFPGRAATYGPAWRWLHPVGAVAASPLPPKEMRVHLDTLKQLTEAEGRDFWALTIYYKAPLYDTGIPSPHGSRRPFSGPPDEIAADIRNFAAIGVHELILDCRGRSISESVERLQWVCH